MTPSTSVAMMVERLRALPESTRATEAIQTLVHGAQSAGCDVIDTSGYCGTAPLLLLWGPGAPDRIEATRRQLAAGGHVVALDAAYWQRMLKFRVSIDAPHPQALVMRSAHARARFDADAVPVSDVWDPVGPVIVAGIGQKARVQYGSAVTAWELAMIEEARAAGYRVQYRRKKVGDPLPAGVPLCGDGAIETALVGCARVVTWHSNVAIDAIRLGIPVVCRDGAAAAVCPSTFHVEQLPLEPSVRDQFLWNLAWFQWAPSEADACWAWITEVLRGSRHS